jgi:hypothetical protein
MLKAISLSMVISGVILLSACSSFNAEKHEIKKLNHKITTHALPICFNHGCSSQENIQVSLNSWNKIITLFDKVSTDLQERQALRKAVSILEKEAAKYTPVGIDQAKNTNIDEHGRQDCVDESTNTTHFLLLLETHNLLKWHKVGSRVYRTHFLIDQHYAAQIIHLQSGERFVVDSWYLSNGELPFIQRYQRWRLKKSFSEIENPKI